MVAKIDDQTGSPIKLFIADCYLCKTFSLKYSDLKVGCVTYNLYYITVWIIGER